MTAADLAAGTAELALGKGRAVGSRDSPHTVIANHHNLCLVASSGEHIERNPLPALDRNRHTASDHVASLS